MKKTLALVLAFALVFSTMTMAFADDAAAIGADAKVCSDLGMLKGATGTVDAAYLATVPNRLQAAVMFLRLKGLEAEANAFTGTENFADANKVNWGKPVMAYLKAHPELGWVGDGTNFDPASAMTAQQYYKVMLEALGYKQNTATVVGDFTWENVVTFAATKGLTKNAAVANFTVNDLAVGTVEALKANVKDTTKTLVATLVEAGKIDKAAATTAGVLVDTTASTAALDAVLASANDGVEVTFDADVAKDFAENVANYKIVVKGSTTALEVKSAKAVSSTVVDLTTAAQTAGTAYTMTVGAVSLNFAGLAKNTGAPEIDTVTCIDTNTVAVTFKKPVDRASAEDVANYTLNNGATVAKAELWIDQDDSRKLVKLTTDGVAKSKIYKLTVANVKSADLVALKSVDKSFSGVTDTTAPKISTVTAINNQRIFVVFDDPRGVDKATAENLANWSIDDLKINSIKAMNYIACNGKTYGVNDTYAYLEVVEIDTDPMTPNHKYTITASNLMDGSYSKNVVAKALTKTFYGLAVDKSAPTMGNVAVIGDSMLEIPFTETNRLDYATATDVNNYTFTEGLQVLSASILKSSKPDSTLGKTVVLTTSTMDKDTTYKLTTANVADEFGNVMKTVTNRSIQRTLGQDIAPPYVLHINYIDKNTVDLYFNEKVDVASAEDPTNYVINNSIGAVKSATVSTSDSNKYMMVELVTPDLTDNKDYKVTINGVKDRLGNEMTSYGSTFTAGMTSIDTEAPTIENITAISNKEVQVTFDEPVVADGATMNVTWIDGGAAALTAKGISDVPNHTGHLTTDDGYTVSFVAPAAMATSELVTVTTISNLIDKHNNKYVVDSNDPPTFYGNKDTDDDAPEVIAIDETNMKQLKVTFSKPILQPTAVITGKKNGGATGTQFTAAEQTVDVDDDCTNEALSVLTIDTAVIPAETDYVLNFSNVLDYAGTPCTDTAYEYTASLDDTDDPVIDYVEAVSTVKVQVHFNEELNITSPGSYSIKGVFTKSTNAESTKTVPAASVYSSNKTIVNLNVTGMGLLDGEVYTLIPKTAARDWNNNPNDIKDAEFDFVASAVVVDNYIKGVNIIDSTHIKVLTTANMTNVSVANGANAVIGSQLAVGNTEATLTLSEPIFAGETYTVTTTGLTNNTFTFEGVVEDGNVAVDYATKFITFSEWDQSSYTVKVVYAGATETILDAAKVAGSGYGFITNIAVGSDYIVNIYRTGDTQPIYAARLERPLP